MSAPVGFISPLTVTAANITSSTAVTHLATELEWNAATDYAVGTVVFRSDIGRRFECLVKGVNSNKPEDDGTRWYDLGATSQLSAFDGEPGTQSIAPNALTFVFKPGAFNAMYLGGIVGQSLEITVKDATGGTAIYTYSGALDKFEPLDYYEHFFTASRPRTDFVVTDLTPFVSCEVTITITFTGSVARCGVISVGDFVSMVGAAESGAKVKTKSYSTFESDSRGKTTIKKGRKARDLAMTVTVPLDMVDVLSDALDVVLDVPCAVLGTDTETLRAMRTFGLLDYEVTLLATEAKFNLTAKGSV